MATEAQNAESEDVKDTSETVPAGTQTTTDKPVDPPTKVEEQDVDESDENELVDEDDNTVDFNDEVPGSLGTVSERGYDVPWTYLTPEHFGEEGLNKARTADSDDVDVVDWHVQKAFETEDEDEVVALVAVAATPGQTFTVDELPNFDRLREAGINPATYLSGLPVRATIADGETHRRGIPA